MHGSLFESAEPSQLELASAGHSAAIWFRWLPGPLAPDDCINIKSNPAEGANKLCRNTPSELASAGHRAAMWSRRLPGLPAPVEPVRPRLAADLEGVIRCATAAV